MKLIEVLYKINPKINKELFKQGEWSNEPDFAEWIDTRTNCKCQIVRSTMLHFCGYVFISKNY